MSNPNMINPQQPNYSGVTIQISNPAVNVGKDNNLPQNSQYFKNNNEFCTCPGCYPPNYYTGFTHDTESCYPTATTNVPVLQPQSPTAYPPQYYLNNYNYQNNGDKENLDKILAEINKNNDNQSEIVPNNIVNDVENSNNDKLLKVYEPKEEIPQDFTKSQSVIEDLDARAAAMEQEKKNSKQKRVVALTDEYIKSLENYLNNPNDEIRLMASKEILTRLDEDKERYNDAALNALLNKMLQDPSKLIRVAALSAFASQLASGNDYTVKLLHDIQSNPSADKEDVIQAADILLKMSAGTEIKNIPNPESKNDNTEKEA